MTKLIVIEYPDTRLKQKSKPVEMVDNDLRKFIDDMLETMYANKGVGLASPQVGVLKRVIVADPTQDTEGQNGTPMSFINPEIIWHSKEVIFENEGCLSVPDQSSEVERFAEVKVKYLDYNGNEQEVHAEGYLAIILQHEIDHLNGVLYIDRISRLKRSVLLRKLEKMRKEQ